MLASGMLLTMAKTDSPNGLSGWLSTETKICLAVIVLFVFDL